MATSKTNPNEDGFNADTPVLSESDIHAENQRLTLEGLALIIGAADLDLTLRHNIDPATLQPAIADVLDSMVVDPDEAAIRGSIDTWDDEWPVRDTADSNRFLNTLVAPVRVRIQTPEPQSPRLDAYAHALRELESLANTIEINLLRRGVLDLESIRSGDY